MKGQRYSLDLKEKALKEYMETKNLSDVSKINKIPVTTLRGWVLKSANPKKYSKSASKKEILDLQKQLEKKNIEIDILKELLKKTNQAWLKD